MVYRKFELVLNNLDQSEILLERDRQTGSIPIRACVSGSMNLLGRDVSFEAICFSEALMSALI